VTGDNQRSFVEDRLRFGRALLIAGIVGTVGALVVGVAGWILAGRATQTVTATIGPLSGIVTNVAETIGASQVMISRTGEAIDAIESATRSTARALGSVSAIVDETSEVLGGDLADGIEAAVESLPAISDTARVIDRTMRALSLVGVNYDPEVPLDVSLTDLEESLRPIPEQLRSQIALLESVQGDVDQIASEAGAHAAVLLEARIDMMEAERVLESTSANVDAAVEGIASLEADIETYDTLARVVVIAATLTLLAVAFTPLVIGIHYRRTPFD
jgi:methyl-accepting chemotaxis protein